MEENSQSLNPYQRLQVYKRLLRRYRRGIFWYFSGWNPPLGLCYELIKSGKSLGYGYFDLDDLLELEEQRSKLCENFSYWFSLDKEGYKKRINLLVNAIEQLKFEYNVS